MNASLPQVQHNVINREKKTTKKNSPSGSATREKKTLRQKQDPLDQNSQQKKGKTPLRVGDGLCLALASEDTSTDGLADTDAETTGDSNKESSDEDLEPQPLLLADAAPPGIDAGASTSSGSSALGSLGLILVAKRLLGWPHCAFFGTAIEAHSGTGGDG